MRRRIPLLIAFLLSGFAALIYQVTWQRALFALYGIDIASVTVIVTAFMVGLGLGSLLGGGLSRGSRSLQLFAAFELAIGIFGFWSLDIFHGVGRWTLELDLLGTGLITMALVLVPTTLMGATLPLLVAHWIREDANTGRSVGALYFANTLGAALACFATAWILLGELGMRSTTQVAAGVNLLLGVLVFLWARRERAPA